MDFGFFEGIICDSARRSITRDKDTAANLCRADMSVLGGLGPRRSLTCTGHLLAGLLGLHIDQLGGLDCKFLPRTSCRKLAVSAEQQVEHTKAPSQEKLGDRAEQAYGEEVEQYRAAFVDGVREHEGCDEEHKSKLTDGGERKGRIDEHAGVCP